MRYCSDKKMEPSTSSQPSGGGTSDDVAVATEVQRTNRLLEIENMDWQWQLKQAVSAFLSSDPPLPFFFKFCHCLTIWLLLSYRASKTAASQCGKPAASSEISKSVRDGLYHEKNWIQECWRGSLPSLIMLMIPRNLYVLSTLYLILPLRKILLF